MPEGPLAGLRVIDLTHYIAGPACTKLFADFGAEVIKVERPGEGDPARRLGPFPEDIPHPEKSGLFLYLNTNKKSVTLNLKTETGRGVLRALVKEADLLVESFSPRVMPSLGLSYEELEQINPRLVMTSVSSFGQTGPYRDYRANELIGYAMSGPMCTGIPEREPQKLGLTVFQMYAGSVAAAAANSALFGAMLQGEGQHVDVAILESIAGSADRAATSLLCVDYSGATPNFRSHSQRLFLMPTGIYPCADGYVHFYTHVAAWWPRFCKMLGRQDLIEDPRFATTDAIYDLAKYSEEIDEILYPWLLSRTRQEIQEQGQAAGMAVTAVNTMEDVFNDPHFRDRGLWVQIDHPLAGKLTYPGAQAILSGSPWRAGRAPLLGEHNAEILGGILGYTKHDLVLLREQGVI